MDKNFFQLENDWYLAVAYIPPENSNYHTIYDVDIFNKLEEELCFYKSKGHKIALLGDLNSRIGRKCDFIENNSEINLEFEYTYGEMRTRNSMDRTSNRFGDNLLDLCKAVNIQCHNGRSGLDIEGRFTCMTHAGESVVDYLLTTPENFTDIKDFNVHGFNEYSNHAPLTFSIITNNHMNSTTGEKYYTYKWNDTYKHEFTESLRKDIHLLDQILTSNYTVNETVEHFTTYINTRAQPFFEKCHSGRTVNMFQDSDYRTQQKWFDDVCTHKRNLYLEALRDFNCTKNNENRRKLWDKKRDYKFYCVKRKRQYKRQLCLEMNEMRKTKPRDFWRLFKRKNNNSCGNIELSEFYEHFKTLASDVNETTHGEVDDFLQGFDENPRDTPTFPELDIPITQTEIKNSIKKLKHNKAHGPDTLLNEYFIVSAELLCGQLQILFNKILDSGDFPTMWTKGIIIPLHKKGSLSDTNNYRGITLVSCFGKIFSSILNERLQNWATENAANTDAQFGFKSKHSTVDAIFILNSLIERHLNNKKRLYCAFIDFKRAFDSVYRNGLWYKLIKSGVNGKLLSLIRSMYTEVKSCVRHLNTLSDLFDCNVGLMQGEICSPLLFALFISDIENSLQENIHAGITLDQLSLYLILFADDAVIFSDTPEGLQMSLNKLQNYCETWNLTVNVDKTKIMVFRKGGLLSRRERWFYNGVDIEIVNQFNYLGVVFTPGGSFIQAAKTLSGKAIRALCSLLSLTKSMEIPLNIMINLYNSFVCSILFYACEIWGFSSAISIDKVQRKFCRWMLNVKQSTHNLAICSELGLYPLVIERQVRIVKYWLKLNSNESGNIILSSVYRNMIDDVSSGATNWLSKVKHLLESNGFAETWIYRDSIISNRFIPVLRQRLVDIYLSNWREGMEASSSLSLFRNLKDSYEPAPYLHKVLNRKYRNAIAKLRLSSHPLLIETGRYTGVPRDNRKCTFCDLNDIEDEYHFVLKCSKYQILRNVYIPNYYTRNPSMFKFIELLNCDKVKTLNNLAVFTI